MTFEEAWPHIKSGEKFRYKLPNGEFSPWSHKLDRVYLAFIDIEKTEFRIKSEPREFTLNIRDGLVMNTPGIVNYLGVPPSPSDIIKVREVIE